MRRIFHCEGFRHGVRFMARCASATDSRMRIRRPGSRKSTGRSPTLVVMGGWSSASDAGYWIGRRRSGFKRI